MIKNKGFTLVELIVVITIIAVITVAGMVSYGATNKKARDSKRVADIEKIRIALEMARQIGNTYPATADVLTTNKYMSVLPTDPKSGKPYDYVRDALSNYKYSIGASMEDGGSANVPAFGMCDWVAPDSPPVPTITAKCNYQVINP